MQQVPRQLAGEGWPVGTDLGFAPSPEEAGGSPSQRGRRTCIQMGSSLGWASEQHNFSCVGWGTVAAALGSRVQPYPSNAGLAVAALPKRDCCEWSITWGQPEMKDGRRGRERGHADALETDFTARTSLRASSDPSAQGRPFPEPCGTVTSPRASAQTRTYRNVMVSVSGELGAWLGGLAQPIAMGCSFAALQNPFLCLVRLSGPVACSSL